MPKLVYDFTEGNKDLKDLLGGKGANLAEMTNLGLPVPPGFIITTDACRFYLKNGAIPDGLASEVSEHLRKLEEQMGRKLGDHADPLLVSVRSGAALSMPGMMNTILNLGLTDVSVDAPDGANAPVTVTASVTNTGPVAGAEVVQVYLGVPGPGQPPKRLAGFRKVFVEPGASKLVAITIDPAATHHPFEVWDYRTRSFQTVPGDYTVYVGTSADNTPHTATVSR